MTNDEFSKWLAYFDACFPSYAEKRNRLADKSTTLVAGTSCSLVYRFAMRW